MNDNGIFIQNMTTDLLLEKRRFTGAIFTSPKEYEFYKKFHAEKEKEIENRRAESEEKNRNQIPLNISK